MNVITDQNFNLAIAAIKRQYFDDCNTNPAAAEKMVFLLDKLANEPEMVWDAYLNLADNDYIRQEAEATLRLALNGESVSLPFGMKL